MHDSKHSTTMALHLGAARISLKGIESPTQSMAGASWVVLDVLALIVCKNQCVKLECFLGPD